MKNILKSIRSYFTSINYSALWNHLQEVLWLTMLAFAPLIINILIATIATNNFSTSVSSKVIPGEVLSYCLSFLAPSMYLVVKTHGSNYRLPHIKLFTITTFLLYSCSIVLYLIAKNKWVQGIDLAHHDTDIYFRLSLIFLFIAIMLRLYSTYHGSFSNWTTERKEEQDRFNKSFQQMLNK